jgi:putative transposase
MDALKRVESGLPVPELYREVCISTATFYKWRAKFGGMLKILRGVIAK